MIITKKLPKQNSYKLSKHFIIYKKYVGDDCIKYVILRYVYCLYICWFNTSKNYKWGLVDTFSEIPKSKTELELMLNSKTESDAFLAKDILYKHKI